MFYVHWFEVKNDCPFADIDGIVNHYCAHFLFITNRIVGVMVSVLASSVVDRGFIGGVMVSVLASSVVDRGFEHRLGQTKNYQIDICCFSAKHAALRRKSKDWLA
jgi:hypothetical protein